MTITITGTEKNVEFKEIYTRKIDREFNAVLFEWTDLWVDWKMTLNPMNMQNANDYLIKAMTNLTQEEIDELSISDYNEILDKVGKIKEGSKK